MPPWIAYAIAALVGAGVGLGEILSRYRDAPGAAASSRAGLGYILFNAAVSLVVMFFIREVFPIWDQTANTAPPTDLRTLVTHALIAGFGAMAILRSSILTARVGSKDVEIGPAAVVDIFRSTMDRDVARVRATPRARLVQDIMGDVSFVRSYEALSSISLTLLQSVDADERSRIEQEIGALANRTGRSDEDKALELGLILAGSVGFPALLATKTALGDRITNSKTRPVLVSEQVARLDTDVILRDLPSVCLALNRDVPTEIQTALSEQIDAIAQSALSEQAKQINAGLVLVNAVGEENFKAAVDLLAPRPAPAPVSPAPVPPAPKPPAPVPPVPDPPAPATGLKPPRP